MAIGASVTYIEADSFVRREDPMTVRRIAVLMAILLLAGTTTGMAAKKQKTGVVTDKVYVDNLYGFSFEAIRNWKFSKPKKEKLEKPKHQRFSLVQKNYQIPPNRRDNQEEYTPPTIMLWVDTCGLSVDSFAVLIADPSKKFKQRKSLANSFTIMKRGHYIEQGPTQIDGAGGVMQKYRLSYETQIYNRVKDSYRVLEEILLGDLYIVKNNGRMYAIGFRAERLNYRAVRQEAKKMIASLNFDPVAEDAAEDAAEDTAEDTAEDGG
jgi:hypothetical protein